jgi:SAM-dependent methyltransferase
MQNHDATAAVEPSKDAAEQALLEEAVTLAALVAAMNIGRDAESGWTDLRPTLLGLIDKTSARKVLEVGGGRFPFLEVDEMRARGADLTVNDLFESELKLAPESFAKRCFDISGDLPDGAELGEFHLVFSRMVFEHVKDAPKAWSNIYRLLAPGGLGFAYVPTLWSPPFAFNRLTPEALSAWLLRKIDPDRTDERVPKFPAYYDLCRADAKAVAPTLEEIGFREVVVTPFFGTPYLPVVPGLKHVARAFDRTVMAADARMFASYAYIIARK